MNAEASDVVEIDDSSSDTSTVFSITCGGPKQELVQQIVLVEEFNDGHKINTQLKEYQHRKRSVNSSSSETFSIPDSPNPEKNLPTSECYPASENDPITSECSPNQEKDPPTSAFEKDPTKCSSTPCENSNSSRTEATSKLRSGKVRKPRLEDSKRPSSGSRKKKEIAVKPRINRYYKYKVVVTNFQLVLEVQADEVKGNFCDSCSSNFNSYKALKQHMTLQHDIALYKCTHCKNQVIGLDDIEDHMITKHSEDTKLLSSFECVSLNPQANIWKRGPKIIDEKYSYSLLAHGGYRLILLCDDTRFPRFTCEVCASNFKCEKNLREHIIDKHSFSVFKCIPCDVIVDFDDLESHLKRSHANFEKASVFKCVDANGANGIVADTIYSYKFVEKDEDLFNLVITYDRKKSRFFCEKCKCNFSNESDIKVHIKEIHSTSRFHCETCNANLDLQSVEQHLIRHGMFADYFLFTSIKPIIAAQTENVTTLSYVLQENQGFDLSLLYGNQLKTCFDCSACLYEFGSALDLQQHMKDQHNIYNFKCSVCTENISFEMLDRHCRSHSVDANAMFRFTCLDQSFLKISSTHYFAYKMVMTTVSGIHMTMINKLCDRDTFECQMCRVCFTTLQEFFVHSQSWHQIRKFECYLCKSVKDAEFTVEHLRMCHVLKPEVVYNFQGIDDTCVKQLSTISSIQWSFTFKRIVLSNNIYEDIYCLQLVTSGSPAFECLVCSTSHSSVLEMKNHLNSLHCSSEMYFCSVCHKVESFKYLNLGCHDHNRNELYFLTVTDEEDHTLQKGIATIIEKSISPSKIISIEKNSPDTSGDINKVSKFYSYVVSSNDNQVFITVNEATNFDFICKSCHLSFLSFPLVKHHLRSIHEAKKFICPYCIEEVTIEAFVFHMTTKHTGSMQSHSVFLCEKPAQKVQTVPDKCKPKQSKLRTLPLECCYSFIAYDGFRLVLSCDKAAIYNCEVCKKTAPTKFHLQIHMKEVHSIKQLKCTKCSVDVKFALLVEHSNYHKLSENCAIFVCIDDKVVEFHKYSMTFAKNSNNIFELFVVKKVEESNIFKCQFCRLEFQDISLFNTHIKAKHKCVQFKCVICSLELDFPKILKHLNDSHSPKAKVAYKFRSIIVPLPSGDNCDYSFRLLDSNEGGCVELKLKENPPVTFKCHLCRSEFDSVQKFDDHIVQKHCAPFVFNCVYCDLRMRIPDFLLHWITNHKNDTRIKFVEKLEESNLGSSVQNELLSDNDVPEPEITDEFDIDIDIKPDASIEEQRFEVEGQNNEKEYETEKNGKCLVANNCELRESLTSEDELIGFHTSCDENISEACKESEQINPTETVPMEKGFVGEESPKEEQPIQDKEHLSATTNQLIENKEHPNQGELKELLSERELIEYKELIQAEEHLKEKELVENTVVKTEDDVDEEPPKEEEIFETTIGVVNGIIEPQDKDSEVYVKNELPLELMDDKTFGEGVEVQNEPLEDDSRPCSGISFGNIEEPESLIITKSGSSIDGVDCYSIISSDVANDRSTTTSFLRDSIQDISSPISSDCESQGPSSTKKQRVNPIHNQAVQLVNSADDIQRNSDNQSEQFLALSEMSSRFDVVKSRPSTKIKTNMLFFAFRIFKDTEISVECRVANKSNQSVCDICCNHKSLSTEDISKHVKLVHFIEDLKCIHCKLNVNVELLTYHAQSCNNSLVLQDIDEEKLQKHILFSYKLILSEKKYILETMRFGTKRVVECTICNITFSSAYTFLRHLKNHHQLIVWFCCSICNSEVTFIGVAEHTSTHNLSLPKCLTYYCLSVRRKIIFKDYEYSYSLVKTKFGFSLQIDDVKTFQTAKCKLCTILFESFDKLEDHIKTTHDLGYICTLCNEVIGFTHIVKHIHFDDSGCAIDIQCIPKKKYCAYNIEKAEYVVKPCPDVLKGQLCIVLRTLQQSIVHYYYCCVCKQSFNCLERFNDHLSTFHNSKNPKFCCVKCKMMVCRSKMNEHFQSHHKNESHISFIDFVEEFEGIPKLANKERTESNSTPPTAKQVVVALDPSKSPSVKEDSLPSGSRIKTHPGTRVIFVPKSKVQKKILPRPELTNPTPSRSTPIQSNILPASKTPAAPSKNIEFEFRFKFTYAMNSFNESCVFARTNHNTEYRCLYCFALEIPDYEHFKSHIESKHLKQPISYSVCDICSKFENIDEFEYHIIQQHLRDNRNLFCFKLLSLDKDIQADHAKSCFSFVCKLDGNRAGRIEVNASPAWKFICGNCQVHFRKISQLQLHLEKNHTIKLSQLACNKCGELFQGLIELPKHALSQHRHHLNIVIFMNLIVSVKPTSDIKNVIENLNASSESHSRPTIITVLKNQSKPGSPKPNLSDKGTTHKQPSKPNVVAVVTKPGISNPVRVIPVTKTGNGSSEIKQPTPVISNPVRVIPVTKTTNDISQTNQSALKRKDEIAGAPPAKQPRKEQPVFTLSYDIDSQNDHCVIARSNIISDNLLCCRLCQIKFRHLSHLVMHIESSHIHDKISYCICEKCCTVLYSLKDLPQHIQTLHAENAKTVRFQFKLISMKTTVLEDVEEGLSMEELLPPPANYQNDEDVIALSD